MNNLQIGKYTRISKATARKMYNAGMRVYLDACNLNPCGTMGAVLVDIRGECSRGFDSLVNEFTALNCINSETGKYIAYYAENFEREYIHFSFTDGSNPYIYHGSILDCLKELERWKRHYIIKLDHGHNMYLLTGARG